MKGRRKDPEFLSQFISDCVQDGKCSPNEMLDTANDELSKISRLILEAEQLKIRRAKLLEVISHFQKDNIQIDRTQEIKQAKLLQISYPEIAIAICVKLIKSGHTREQLSDSKFDDQNINFCIKQLIQHQVINRSGDLFIHGEQFQFFIKMMDIK